MWMHFPLEFAHLFTNKLAFWHSDVLPPIPTMRKIAAQFEVAQDGQLVGVKLGKPDLILMLKRYLRGKPAFYKRWWEVIGCTTAGASRSQYEHGCGWWRNPQDHPNATLEVARENPFKEHGVGIYLWQSLFAGPAVELCVDIQRYHYSTNQPGYRRERDKNGRIANSKQWELSESFDLDKIAHELGLE
jgi:hypothetical protein